MGGGRPVGRSPLTGSIVSGSPAATYAAQSPAAGKLAPSMCPVQAVEHGTKNKEPTTDK